MKVSLTEQRVGLKLRKNMLQKLKNQVMLYLGKETSSLRRYALPYKKDIERSRWKISSGKEVADALADSDVILGGDFHAFAQAQRSHLRLLRELAVHKKIILALECVPSTKQRVLDAYMQNKIGEDEFLKKIMWNKFWGFPWSQYKPLFELVKATGGRCLAVNSVQSSRSLKSLNARDKHAADRVVEAVKHKESNEAVYVLFGDLHIAREHLQKWIKKRLPKVKLTTVYLNPEKLYFQLYKKNQDHATTVVRFSQGEFCLIESPPWVKWQSYLIYLNEYYDESLDDDGNVDYSEHVLSLVHIIASDLSISVDDNLTVYSFNDLDFMDILEERLSVQDFASLKERVSNDISCYIPQLKMAFLARGTVNYSAHLAGLAVHAKASGQEKLLLPSDVSFEVLIWQEAIGFCLSKMINPNRKSMRIDDLKKQLQAFSPDDKGEQALRLALDQKMQDLLVVYGNPTNISARRVRKSKESITYLKAAKILGAMMGEKIYVAYRTGHLSKDKVKAYIQQPVDAQNFYDFYTQVLKTIDKIELEETYG
jgi:hypothetical protein